jgi:hypothetical protein
MSGETVRTLATVIAGFVVGCVVILATGGQRLMVTNPSVDMAVQPMATQSKFMQPMQQSRHRTSTKVNVYGGQPLPSERLVPCKESKAFAKRQKQALKELEKREKKYEDGSVPFLALESTKARAVARFENYAKAGLLCGTDGLPHLIAEPGLAIKYGHTGEINLPTIGFLLVAGWIGESGRLYLSETNSRDKEIIIDVPKALSCLGRACAWPATTLSRLRDGTLTKADVKP